MKTIIYLIALPWAFGVWAEEPASELGFSDIKTQQDQRAMVRRALDAQAQRPAKGGELNSYLYVKTQERLANTFERPMPENISVPTSE